MNIRNVTTEDLRYMGDKEGLVLPGCGGEPKEWVDGINQMLTEAGILLDGTEFKKRGQGKNASHIHCMLAV